MRWVLSDVIEPTVPFVGHLSSIIVFLSVVDLENLLEAIRKPIPSSMI
jgi:hypothetical protein